LEKYRGQARIFNDDMQGTGAITLAAILAGLRVAGTRPSEQRAVIFGAGTAGVGIADQIRVVMVRDGLSESDATRRFWCVDRQGLLVDDMDDLRDFQQGYARPRAEVADWGADGRIGLLEVVENVHPTIMVGTSTQGGAFTEQVLRAMAAAAERPLIFPLSNPTERIEAVPADVIKWTDGRGLVGTGTPWGPVPYKGTNYQIGQANNALIYPGIGLGTIVARAEHVTDGMLLAASDWSTSAGPAPGCCPRSRTCGRSRPRSPWPWPSRRRPTASPTPSPIRCRRCRMGCGRRPTVHWG
jgi:malate dehydrogenase (oxaloacetate-decarboxylating)